MSTPSRLILAALAATMLLAIAVDSAVARNFRVGEKNFEMIWGEELPSPKGKREVNIPSTGTNIQCKVTYLGRFSESTIKKETGTTQGNVNHVEFRECTGGTAMPHTETLPWPVRYSRFIGRLPNIGAIILDILDVWSGRETGGLECEARAEVNHPSVAIVGNSTEAPETGLERRGEPENVTIDRSARIPLSGEGFLCAFAGEAEEGGIGLLKNLPRTALLHLTLI